MELKKHTTLLVNVSRKVLLVADSIGITTVAPDSRWPSAGSLPFLSQDEEAA